MPKTIKDYTNPTGKPNWCPGCGNFGIEMALKQAMANLNLNPDEVVLVSGIGCGANCPYWFSTYGLVTLHGRSLPVATGVKLANHALTVIDWAGDGDAYGIGMGHFIHSMRRNANLTYIVSDNTVYGLTRGQASPTADKGMKTPSTPFGTPDPPINPIVIALSVGCSFVARGYAGNVPHLAKLIAEGIKHKGFAFIDVLQPCVTYAKARDYNFYKEKTYDLAQAGHNPSDRKAAFDRAFEEPEKFPIGIFYQAESEVYEDVLPQFKKGPLVTHDILNVDVKPLFEFYSA